MKPPETGLNLRSPAGRDPDAAPEAEERQHRLEIAICEFLEARESGAEPDRRAWLSRYPDLVPELTKFLESSDVVGWVLDQVLPSDPDAGARFGPYRIRRLLGKGGMGFVYEVEDEPSETACRLALKVLPTWGA